MDPARPRTRFPCLARLLCLDPVAPRPLHRQMPNGLRRLPRRSRMRSGGGLRARQRPPHRPSPTSGIAKLPRNPETPKKARRPKMQRVGRALQLPKLRKRLGIPRNPELQRRIPSEVPRIGTAIRTEIATRPKQPLAKRILRSIGNVRLQAVSQSHRQHTSATRMNEMRNGDAPSGKLTLHHRTRSARAGTVMEAEAERAMR